MLVELDPRGDICVVRLHGKFVTGRDSTYLRERSEELKRLGASKVLADFSQVDYIDSTGMGFLISIYSTVTENPNGRFVLCNLNRRVREVLELTRLANVMPIYPDEEVAIRALDEGQKMSAPQSR